MRHLIAFAAALVLFTRATAARADVLYASSDYTPFSSASALVVGETRFFNVVLGSRFRLDQPAEVTSLGVGDVGSGNGRLYIALVPLAGPASYPEAGPGGEPVAPTLPIAGGLIPPYPAFGELNVPVTAHLSPGDYAIIVGSGLFGAQGDGLALFGNHNTPGATFLTWQTDHWQEPTGGVRFVVEGRTVPEPSAFTLLLMFGVMALRRRHRRAEPERGHAKDRISDGVARGNRYLSMRTTSPSSK